MSSILSAAVRVFCWPGLTPLVLGCFLFIYGGIAFGTEEALSVLMELVRSNRLLCALLALIPVNAAARLVREVTRQKAEASAAKSGTMPLPAFDEEVTLKGTFDLQCLGRRLRSSGYRTRSFGTSLAAVKGVSEFPGRILLLASFFCLFAGILLSITTRTVQREPVIEGEPFPFSGEVVRSVVLSKIKGWLFDRGLAITVGVPGSGAGRSFGIYPPGVDHGYFVYPRYLGVAPLIRFSAPGLIRPVETHFILMIYPPGKEDSADIEGSPYRIYFTLTPPQRAEDDPYRTGRFLLEFRVFNGKHNVSSGTVALGGIFDHDGFRIEFPEVRRVVATDFVRDSGVRLIWLAMLLGTSGVLFLAPVKFFFPRREMHFNAQMGAVRAFSRADGKRRSHGETFHEALDFLETLGGDRSET